MKDIFNIIINLFCILCYVSFFAYKYLRCKELKEKREKLIQEENKTTENGILEDILEDIRGYLFWVLIMQFNIFILIKFIR